MHKPTDALPTEVPQEVRDQLKGKILLVMDGHCGMCSSGAYFIAQYDHDDRVRITITGDPLGRQVLQHHGLDPLDPDSWLLLDVDTNTALTEMDAYPYLGRALHKLGKIFLAVQALPASWRGPIYRFFARNRYKIYGKISMLGLPSKELRRRLLLKDV